MLFEYDQAVHSMGCCRSDDDEQRLILSGLLFGVGCAPASVDMDLDDDGDGLLASKKVIGTDP